MGLGGEVWDVISMAIEICIRPSYRVYIVDCVETGTLALALE